MIKVQLRRKPALCSCCQLNEISLYRGERRISFFVCSAFAKWFRGRYGQKRPTVTEVWRALSKSDWILYALSNVEATLWLAFRRSEAFEASPADLRRCVSPDLIEALVAEKLDAM